MNYYFFYVLKALWKCSKHTSKTQNAMYTSFFVKGVLVFDHWCCGRVLNAGPSICLHLMQRMHMQHRRVHTFPLINSGWQRKKKTASQYKIHGNIAIHFTRWAALKDTQIHIVWCCIYDTWLACENRNVCIFFLLLFFIFTQ